MTPPHLKITALIALSVMTFLLGVWSATVGPLVLKVTEWLTGRRHVLRPGDFAPESADEDEKPEVMLGASRTSPFTHPV